MPPDADLAGWWANDPLALPIRSCCSSHCAAAQPDVCHIALLQVIGGYGALVRIRAPSPLLMAEDRFASSPLAHQIMERLADDMNKITRRSASDGPICKS